MAILWQRLAIALVLGILSEMSHALFADLAHDFNLENPQCQWNGKQIVRMQCKQIAVGMQNDSGGVHSK